MSLAPPLAAPFAIRLHGAVYYARRHNSRAHRKSMRSVYIGGLLIAGRLTRRTNQA